MGEAGSSKKKLAVRTELCNGCGVGGCGPAQERAAAFVVFDNLNWPFVRGQSSVRCPLRRLAGTLAPPVDLTPFAWERR